MNKFFGGNLFKRNKFFAFFLAMLMPFMSFAQLSAVSDGSGLSAHEQEEKEQQEKLTNQIVEKFKDSLLSAQNEANKRAEALEAKVEKKDADFYAKVEAIGKEFDERVGVIESEIKNSDNAVIEKFSAEMAKLKEVMVKQGEQINKNIRDNTQSAKNEKSFYDCVKDAIEKQPELFEENEIAGKKVRGFKGVNNANFRARFELETGAKAAVDMTAANVLGGDSADFFTTYDPNLVEIRLTNNVHVEQIFSSQMIQDKYFTILVETGYFDGAETRLEGAAGAQSSFTLTTVTFNVFDISTDFLLSRETLEDMNLFMTEINRLAPDKIASKFDEKILAGSGDGTTDFKPLSSYATAIDFAVTQTGYKGTVTSANIIDVFAAVQSYLESVDEMPNFAISHTNEIFKLGALKDGDGNSINDRRVSWTSGMPTNISGLTIVKNRKVGANKMFIGDVREALIAKRGNLTVEVGYDSDNFSKRMVYVRCDMRAAFAVRRNAAFAYVDDVDQAIVDLTPTS